MIAQNCERGGAGHALGARNCCSALPLLFAFFVHSIARFYINLVSVCLPSTHTHYYTCVCLDYKRLISTRTPLYPAQRAYFTSDRVHTTHTFLF